MSNWRVFSENGTVADVELPEAPPWRRFDRSGGRASLEKRRAETYCVPPEAVEAINAAICLRRPLLVTGKPGTGKSTLAFVIAQQLRLGRVLVWPINTRSTLREGLYRYDAVGRLQDISLQTALHTGRKRGVLLDKAGARRGAPDPQDLANVGSHVELGPLGTAFLPRPRPRVLLIDEIDKSDVDLPNDLLHIFEEGQFEIPELSRALGRQQSARVRKWNTRKGVRIRGVVRCRQFPIVVLTSNEERDFPPAFKRRCISLRLQDPTESQLVEIVRSHFSGPDMGPQGEIPWPELERCARSAIQAFSGVRKTGALATDQLLNAVHLALYGAPVTTDSAESGRLLRALFQDLSEGASE